MSQPLFLSPVVVGTFSEHPTWEVSVKAYCVKCKASRYMVNVENVTMKNGRAAAKGKCPQCGTGMFCILKK